MADAASSPDIPDLIRLKSIRAATWLGVPAEERVRPQTVSIDVDLEPSAPLSGLGDDFDRTIDYETVMKIVREVAVREKRRLVETLAEEIADELVGVFALRRATVHVWKYVLPDVQAAGVRVTRRSRSS